jgi:hypothetical protein
MPASSHHIIHTTSTSARHITHTPVRIRIIYAHIPRPQRIMTKSTPQAGHFVQNISRCLSSRQHDVSFHRLYLLSPLIVNNQAWGYLARRTKGVISLNHDWRPLLSISRSEALVHPASKSKAVIHSPRVHVSQTHNPSVCNL